MTEGEEKPSLTRALFMILLIVPEGLGTAWVFTTLWRWFATPTFHWPAPSVPMMAGLFCMKMMVTKFTTPKESYSDLLTKKITVLALLLGSGYVFHLMA